LEYVIGFREVSGLLVTDQAAGVAQLAARANDLNRAGLHAEYLSRDEVRRAEPGLSEIVQGGLYCRESARIYSPGLVVGFARAAMRLGAKICTETAAVRIHCRQGSAEAVETNTGMMRAGTIVLAAGADSAVLGQTAGITLPLEMHRGELLVAAPGVPIGAGIVNELETAHGSGESFLQDAIRRYEVRLVLSREANGNCLIGRSSEPLSRQDRGNVFPVIGALSGNACRFIAALSRMQVIRAFSGIRSMSADGLPIVGPAEGVGALFLSVGHGDKGVNTSPVIAKLLAAYMASGKEPALLRAFSPARFGSGGGAKT
jgi:sarcosine oxidase subunit beta